MQIHVNCKKERRSVDARGRYAEQKRRRRSVDATPNKGPGKKKYRIVLISRQCPGGGFSYVGSLHEGFPLAQRISELGLNAFVIRYRIGAERKGNTRKNAYGERIGNNVRT